MPEEAAAFGAIPIRTPPKREDEAEIRAFVHKFVTAFYARVAKDDLLAPIFVDLAKVDWVTHIPKLVDFWCMVEYGIPGFDGSPTAKHIQFSAHIPFTAEHFERWVSLFHDTLDRIDSGPRVDSIKAKAVAIAKAQSHMTPSAEAWDGMGSA